MRWVLPFLLVAAARAEETRAWKGVITVRATARIPRGSRGHEEQTEKIEFMLVTRESPEGRKNPPVPLAMRGGHGTYSLSIDTRGRFIAIKGRKTGVLHPQVSGSIDPSGGRLQLRVTATPRTLVVLALMSGVHRGVFRTWRTAVERNSILAGFTAVGKIEGAVASGRENLVDRKSDRTRDVVVEWRIERVDPELRGRVVDHLGRPVAGVVIHARTTNPRRAKKKLPPHFRSAKSDKHGRFKIEAFWSHWRVQLIPFLRNGVVYSWTGVEGVDLRFDNAPKKELLMQAYALAELPDAHLLEGHFRGDVAAYLNYIRPRAGEERMKRARVSPAEGR